MTPTTQSNSSDSLIVRYFKDFSVLKETRSEYWGIQIVNFLDSMFYFAMLTIVSLFLSKDLGMSDTNAGYSITIFTSASTLLLLFSGAATDWLGVRKSIGICMSSLLVLRLGVVAVGLMDGLPHRGIIASVLFVLMAPFMAGMQTTFQAATARFTTRRSRSAGFNLWYLFMNVGAAAAGFGVDALRVWLRVPNANTHIFSMGVVTAALCLVAALTLVRREEQLIGPDDPPEPEDSAKAPRKSPLAALGDMMAHSAVWRLITLIALILGVRAVFLYFYLLMPKYWERTMGVDAQIGLLTAINPVGIVIGLILFIPLANRYPVFKMLIYGAMLSSIALFPLAMPWHWYPWDIVTTHYVMAILAMVLVTLGEVIWSPKLNEYTASIAPKGQEGAYLGMSMIPWFLAKTTVSMFSGHLLNKWSPAEVTVSGTKGEPITVPLQTAMKDGLLDYWHRPEAMWLILGLYAMAGCLGALALRKWFAAGEQKAR